jgi:peptide/nickel transport system ATP-binding protein
MQQQHGTAVVFITHDLRLAAQLCDQIVVMYAGRAIESGIARSILSEPAHPYTRCLQLANPTMHEARRTLYVMPDQMPSLRQLANMRGCHFAARCPLVVADCRQTEPPNVAIANAHRVACIRATDVANIATTETVAAKQLGAQRIILQVERLQKRYAVGDGLFGGARMVEAVKDASFSVAENEFVALVGESGGGKSTIARLLVGLERASGGRILLNGEDLTDPSLRGGARSAASVQMVFQDPQSALNPRRRVASIVTQAMEAGTRHASWEERLKRTGELLSEIGLAADFPGQLSGGQRQRVNIGRALCNIPKILIADEIVSGLDVSIQAQLLNLLTRLRSELSFAMLFISHDLSVVRHMCSRVLVMYRGEIVEQGPIETVFADPKHAHTRALLSSVPPDDPQAPWPAIQPAAIASN